MYVIIGSHFVPLEGKFLLIALVIVRITLNVMCDIKNGVSIVQKLVVKLSNTLTLLFSPVAKTENKRHKMASNYDVHSPPSPSLYDNVCIYNMYSVSKFYFGQILTHKAKGKIVS
jgi:hypothetical protein